MSRKQRLALAYCVSFVVNGLFWLAYGRELRRSSADAPRKPDTTAALKPVVLGRYVPLPPAVKREPRPADDPSRVSGAETADKAGGASQSARASGSQATAGTSGKTGGAQGMAGTAGGAQGQSQSAQTGMGAAAQLAQGQTAGGGAAQSGSSGMEKAGTSANGKAGASGASNQSQSGSGASHTQIAGQKTAGAGTSGKKLAQGQKPTGKTHNAPNLKETASLAAEQKDNKEGSDTKTAEKKAAQDEPAKKPKPTSAISLKIVKMWTPKPGQKFNLASTLNISLPKTLELVPGPPLTSEQIEQLKKLLQQQKLRHVGLDRKQLKKLLEARRTTESKRPDKPKPGDDARKRERERQAHKPKPRVPHPTNKTPKLASATMQRPRSPFTYKQWNSDMFKRWAPRENVADTSTPPGSLGTGSTITPGARIASNQGIPGAGNSPGGSANAGNDGQNNSSPAGTQGAGAEPNKGANGAGVLGGGPAGGNNPAPSPQNGGQPTANNPGGGNANNGAQPGDGAPTGDGNQNNGGGLLGGTPGGNPPAPGGSTGNPAGQPGGANTPAGNPGGANPPAGGNPGNGGAQNAGAPGNGNNQPTPSGGLLGGGAPTGNPGGAPPAGGNQGQGNPKPGNAGGGILGGGPPAGNPGGAPTAGGKPTTNVGNPGGGLLGGGTPAGNPGGNPPPGGQGQGNPGGGNPPANPNQDNAGGGILGGGAPAGTPGGANAPAGNPGGGAPAGNPGGGAPAGGNPPATNQGNAGAGLLGGGAPAGNPGGAPGGQGSNQANAGGGNPPANQNQGNAGGLLGGGAPAGSPGGANTPGGKQGQGNAGGGLLGGGAPPANPGNQNNAGPGGMLGGGAPTGNPGGGGPPGNPQGNAGGGLLGGGNPAPNGGAQNAGGPAAGGLLGGGGAPAGGNQPPAGGMLGGGGPPAGNQGQANAGQAGGPPGGMLGGGQAGNQPPGQNPGGAPGQVGDAGQGQQVASAGMTGDGTGQGTGSAEGAMFLGGEQGDGMDAGENEVQGNMDDTGFPPAVSSAPDLPAENPNAKKGIPGSLVLPPSPPMGTETGKLPTPRPVKKTLIQMATEGAPAAQGHQATRPLPSSAPRAPQKMAKTPVGMPTKPRRKAVRLALTVGSTSLNGTLPFTVMDRPHLPIGAVSDAVDPPLPPAKGTPKSLLVAPKSEPARSEKATRSARPNRAGKPVAAKQASPPIVRMARNSQGIKNGTEQPLPPTPLPDSDMEVGDGSGLKGEYYLGRKFDQYQFTRADAMVDFDWRPGESPSPRIPSGSDYTIRWTGKIQPKYSETYTFYATADDGVRIWIDHKLIIDDWSAHAAAQFSNKIPLQAGQQYLFKVEYLETNGGAATVQLYWESPSQPKEFIPENAFFYPLPGDEQDMKRDKAPL